MLRLNNLLKEHGFRRATHVKRRQMWVRGTEAVVRHEHGSDLHKFHGIQCLELIDKNNTSRIFRYDNPNMEAELIKFIGGNNGNKTETQ